MCCKVKLTHVSSKAFLVSIALIQLPIKEHIGEVDLVKLYLEVISQRYLYCQILQIVVSQYTAALPICWWVVLHLFQRLPLASVVCRQVERLYSLLERLEGIVCLLSHVGEMLRRYSRLIYITTTFCDVKVYFSIVYVLNA